MKLLHYWKYIKTKTTNIAASDGSVSGLGPEDRPTESYFKGTKTDRRPDKKDRPITNSSTNVNCTWLEHISKFIKMFKNLWFNLIFKFSKKKKKFIEQRKLCYSVPFSQCYFARCTSCTLSASIEAPSLIEASHCNTYSNRNLHVCVH